MRRFIYLDTDTLNSYIAQIYDGLVQTQETETQSSQATDKQSEYTSDLGADADLKVFGKGIEGKMDFTYRHLKETSNTELISDVQTKYMRDSIDMTSFKFGGKIKVLGYITNKITTDTYDSTNISPLAQVGIGLNQIMLSFFGQQSSLNIVHPIAIYYE